MCHVRDQFRADAAHVVAMPDDDGPFFAQGLQAGGSTLIRKIFGQYTQGHTGRWQTQQGFACDQQRRAVNVQAVVAQQPTGFLAIQMAGEEFDQFHAVFGARRCTVRTLQGQFETKHLLLGVDNRLANNEIRF